MEEVAPSSKFVGHSTEIIRQSKIKGPFTKQTKIVHILFPFWEFAINFIWSVFRSTLKAFTINCNYNMKKSWKNNDRWPFSFLQCQFSNTWVDDSSSRILQKKNSEKKFTYKFCLQGQPYVNRLKPKIHIKMFYQSYSNFLIKIWWPAIFEPVDIGKSYVPQKNAPIRGKWI